jgi:hypothetical protein
MAAFSALNPKFDDIELLRALNIKWLAWWWRKRRDTDDMAKGFAG